MNDPQGLSQPKRLIPHSVLFGGSERKYLPPCLCAAKPALSGSIIDCRVVAQACKVWSDFFSPVCRYLGQPYGALRTYYTLDDIGMEVYYQDMDMPLYDKPIERMWGVYAPSSYDGSEALPVVVVTHGFTGQFSMFAHNNEWWRVAEDRNFIAVFPQATPFEGSKAGTARWVSQETEESVLAEITYFENVLDSVKENYNVDETRIYATGHSNGGRMTYELSEYMADTFAATAAVGNSVKRYETIEDTPQGELIMPYYNIECEYDNTTNPDDPEGNLYWEMMYRLKTNRFDDPTTAEYTENYNGLYSMRTYQNDQGIPVVQYSVYDDACHAYFPEISYLVWDNFFTNYSRDENGNSYYRGELIEK